MGSDQAIWPELFGGGSTPQPGYFILDGNGQSQGIGCGQAPSQNLPASDCGLRVRINSIGQDSGFDIGQNNNDGQHRSSSWTLRYFEIQGGAFYRIHSASMQRTKHKSRLIDFVQRKAAFDHFLQHAENGKKYSEKLTDLANRALAREAL
jgi:hypothetical protein